MTLVLFGFSDSHEALMFGHVASNDEHKSSFRYYVSESHCAPKYAKGKEGPAFVLFSKLKLDYLNRPELTTLVYDGTFTPKEPKVKDGDSFDPNKDLVKVEEMQ